MKRILPLIPLLFAVLLFAYFHYSKDDHNKGVKPSMATKSAGRPQTGRDSGNGNSAEISAALSKVKAMFFNPSQVAKDQRGVNKDMLKKMAKIGNSKNALLSGLKLPPEKLKLAKQLLVEYESLPENTLLQMRRDGRTDLTRAMVQDQYEINRQELLNNFKTLLTDDQFTFLEYYLKTEPYRGDGGRLAGNMEKDTAVKLTPENREAFIGMLADGTEALRIATHGYTTVNDLEKNKYMRQYFIENGGTILTSAQLNWVIKYYDKEISSYVDVSD